jgi:hypothetical protein
MRYMIRSVSITIMIMTLASTSACAHSPTVKMSQAQQSILASSKDQQTRVLGEYLVTLAAGENEGAISDKYARFGIKRIQALGNSTFLLSITDDIGPEGMRTIIEQDTRFKAVQPNFIYKANQPGRNAK